MRFSRGSLRSRVTWQELPGFCRGWVRRVLPLWIFLLLQIPASAQVKDVRRVLIFNELGLWSPGVAAINNEIFAELKKSPYQIEFYS